MTEWEVVLVLSALVGLFFAVGKPIITLNGTITSLNERIQNILKEQAAYEKRNSDTHGRIFKTLDSHEQILDAHAIRLHDLDGK